MRIPNVNRNNIMYDVYYDEYFLFVLVRTFMILKCGYVRGVFERSDLSIHIYLLFV